MSRVTILRVPYDSGHRDFGMGLGPERLLARGAVDRLKEAGHEVEVEMIDVDPEGPVIEPGFTFLVLRRLAGRVRGAAGAGSFPLVLAGNCMTSVATTAGLDPESLGVIWFDAHGDLNTPETSPSAFLDGMALTSLMGRCWKGATAGIEGFRPLPVENVVLVGARDLDPGERELIESSGLVHLSPGDLEVDTVVSRALDELRGRVRRVHLHLDLDVLDPSVAKFNRFPAPGGLAVEQVEVLIGAMAERFEIAAAAATAFDPQFDDDGRASTAALRIIEAIGHAIPPRGRFPNPGFGDRTGR
jgi:arginase